MNSIFFICEWIILINDETDKSIFVYELDSAASFRNSQEFIKTRMNFIDLFFSPQFYYVDKVTIPE